MKVTKELFNVENGKGYKIFIDGNLYINQPHKPCVGGIVTMTSQEAERIANIVVEKIKKGLSPAVTLEELK
jgi:hypothetical protein